MQQSTAFIDDFIRPLLRQNICYHELSLFLGILGVLVGVYSVIHPMLLAFTFGILVGVYFIESGISMIVMAQYIPGKEE